MMTYGIIFSLLIGALFGAVIAAAVCRWVQSREARTTLADDDQVIRALYERLRRPVAKEAADDQTVAGIRQAARKLLDMTVALVASAAGLVNVKPSLAAEYDRGIRATLGTVKGLLDCSDSLVAPLAVAQGRTAGQLLKQVEKMRRTLEDRISRHRLDGIELTAEAEAVARLKNALSADVLLVASDPQQAVAVLVRQIGFLNDIGDDVELKTARLPQA